MGDDELDLGAEFGDPEPEPAAEPLPETVSLRVLRGADHFVAAGYTVSVTIGVSVPAATADEIVEIARAHGVTIEKTEH